MEDIMQLLYDHVLAHTYGAYLTRTEYGPYRARRRTAEDMLVKRLSPDQQSLFEEYQEYDSKTDLEELYAMFLAAYDLGTSLSHPQRSA